MTITAPYSFKGSKDNIILSAPSVPKVLGHCLLQLPVDDVPPVLSQPFPWLPAAAPQVLLGWGLATPQQVQVAPRSFAVYFPLYWNFLSRAVDWCYIRSF
jgi:hypothetical protein